MRLSPGERLVWTAVYAQVLSRTNDQHVTAGVDAIREATAAVELLRTVRARQGQRCATCPWRLSKSHGELLTPPNDCVRCQLTATELAAVDAILGIEPALRDSGPYGG